MTTDRYPATRVFVRGHLVTVNNPLERRLAVDLVVERLRKDAGQGAARVNRIRDLLCGRRKTTCPPDRSRTLVTSATQACISFDGVIHGSSGRAWSETPHQGLSRVHSSPGVGPARIPNPFRRAKPCVCRRGLVEVSNAAGAGHFRASQLGHLGGRSHGRRPSTLSFPAVGVKSFGHLPPGDLDKPLVFSDLYS